MPRSFALVRPADKPAKPVLAASFHSDYTFLREHVTREQRLKSADSQILVLTRSHQRRATCQEVRDNFGSAKKSILHRPLVILR